MIKNKMRIDYDSNLSCHKKMIKEINDFFTDKSNKNLEISKYYTDDFIFYSFPAGYKKGIKTCKSDYLNKFILLKEKHRFLKIVHSIYLPGIDKDSWELNGSVRVYYGAIISEGSKNVEFSGYQTIDFVDGKIYAIWEWADYGGINNLLSNY